MTTHEEYIEHRTDKCELYPMMFVYKYKRGKKRNRGFISKGVVDRLKEKFGEDLGEKKRKEEEEYLKRYTIPTGHIILEGSLEEYKKLKEGI